MEAEECSTGGAPWLLVRRATSIDSLAPPTASSAALGFIAKVSIAIALGLSFTIIWTSVSPTSSSQQISTKRSSFAAEVAAPPTAFHNRTAAAGGGGHAHRKPRSIPHSHKKRHPAPSGSHSLPHRSNATASLDAAVVKPPQLELEDAPWLLVHRARGRAPQGHG